MTRHVLFFDDYPLASENQLFLFNLRKAFRNTDVSIREEKTVPHLEQSLRLQVFAAVILDVMAAFPEAPELEAIAGMEVLRRSREGTYGSLNQQTAFYMRSARGELHVHEAARNLGADWFEPGSDDEKLIRTLQKRLL